MEVLTEDKRKGQISARTNNYILTILENEELGVFKKVKIKKADKWNLFT
ncbi:hypothetical protein C0585_04630 [Candidatus Woesearchaeota archaeon]|nr:MAG: hypothetical protein C0585_04630 [Candidatus Woesearchaeota archaeon]